MLEIWNQLTKEIKKHDTIIIMAHKEIDLDALGSAFCLYEIIESFEKECYIFLDTAIENMDGGIKKAFLKLEKRNIQYLYPNHYKHKLNENCLLVILDTHRRDRIAFSPILENLNDVIVIDHHIKGPNYLKETLFSYINSGLSSITEFMIHYAKYLNKTISKEVSTIMLAGIAIDTNEYRMKTSESTYKASSLLMEAGASNIGKLEFMREDKEECIKRLDFVRNSEMIKDHISLCMMDNGFVSSRDLAIVSESLLQFDDIDAAFSIGKLEENKVGISARSIGTMNVEKVMGMLGGGGHMTEAACQLENVTLEDAKAQLIKIINEEN